MKKIKKFIRILNIKERKAYSYSLTYTIFTFIHLLITKILSKKMNYSYFLILTKTGSVMSIISMIRLFMTIKKLALLEKDDFVTLFKKGFNSFLSFALQIYSIYNLNLTNISIILRLYPFCYYLSENILNDYEIRSNIRACFFFSVLIFLVIFIKNVDNNNIFGIFISLITIIFKVISSLNWKNTKGTAKDFLLLSNGYLSAGVGGILLILFPKYNTSISFFGWIFICLNALCISYKKILLVKLLKSKNNMDKIIMSNIMLILVSIPVDLLIFKEKYEIYYTTVILILVGINLLNVIFLFKNSMDIINNNKNII